MTERDLMMPEFGAGVISFEYRVAISISLLISGGDAGRQSQLDMSASERLAGALVGLSQRRLRQAET